MPIIRPPVPAAPANMTPWILQVLEGGPHGRSELLQAANVLAQPNGFLITGVSALKKTLMLLRKKGLVENIRPGWWALASKPFLSDIKPEPLTIGRRSIPVLRAIGDGPEDVYVFQYRHEVEAANLTGKTVWKCKIGKSKDAKVRLLNAASTFMSDRPEVGLRIKCRNSGIVENAIHRALEYHGQKIQDSAGKEWFMTNSDQVTSFYKDWLKACAIFKKPPP